MAPIATCVPLLDTAPRCPTLRESVGLTASDLLLCGRGTSMSTTNQFDLECLLAPAKVAKLCPTATPGLRSNVGSGSISLRRWLDHFEDGVAAVPSALKRIDALLPGCAAGGEVTKYIENSSFWLRRADEAVTLLRVVRDQHRPAPGTEDQASKPHDEYLLAEWASYNAVSALIEAVPAIVEQVAVYHESLKARVRDENEVSALKGKVVSLQESLRSEQRHRDLFQERMRKLQHADRVQQSRSATEASETESDLSAPTYSEKQMKDKTFELEQKFAKLEEELQGRLLEQRRQSDLEAKSLREELHALKASRTRSGSAGLRRAATSPAGADVGVGVGVDAEDAPVDTDRLPSAGRAGSAAYGDCHIYGGPAADAYSGAGGAGRQGRVGSQPLSRVGQDSASVASRRPGSAVCTSGHKTWEAGAPCSATEHRRVAEDLKRRVFEQVLSEERERRLREASEEEEGLAALCAAQGSVSLASLLRRVEDQHLRHEIFQAIQSQPRVPSALQIVCVYCRRKVKPEQIHDFDAIRPSSAASTISTRASGRLVPRSSSAPSIAVGLPGGMRIFGGGDAPQPAPDPASSPAGGSGRSGGSGSERGAARGSRPQTATVRSASTAARAASGSRPQTATVTSAAEAARAASAGRTRPASGGWKPRRLVAVVPRAPLPTPGK